MVIQFKVGDTVKCPADCDSPEYIGQVANVSSDQNMNIYGTPHYWVTVELPDGKLYEVWPSHRITLVARAGRP